MNRRCHPVVAILVALSTLGAARVARGDNTLHIVSTALDRPTVVSLGVRVAISGDDNYNATIGLRYRVAGSSAWQRGLDLFRVHPSAVTGHVVTPNFSGSVFDLAPDTAYDIELHAFDLDGLPDTIMMLPARTRPVPRANPTAARAVPVTDAASLSTALRNAQPGDVITLANGVYTGNFAINASGTVDNPIVVHGASQDGAVIDGGGCTGCNAIEVYGSYVTIEQLTIQHAERAIRYQGMGTTANVLRRVHIRDVTLGIGGGTQQTDFYLCDNILEGRLTWPTTYASDGAAHASDDGIVVHGSGMVVCHNRLSGFADSIQNAEVGTRSNDFYGNDSLWNYDDGIELDESEGNARCFRNRWTNTYDALSFQPVYGGPAYVFRNVIVNVVNEQFKLHSEGSASGPMVPSGVIIVNNTIVRSSHALQLSTPDAVHYYIVENNLMIGPSAPDMGITLNWDTPIDYVTALIDFNGYAPDGVFHFGYGATGMDYPNFAAVRAGGRYEPHGTLVGASNFVSGLTAPTDWHPLLAPASAALAAGSLAIDRATIIANVSDGFAGTAPDLGAVESGCDAPTYGPRAIGTDERNESHGCVVNPVGSDAGASDAATDASAVDAGGVDVAVSADTGGARDAVAMGDAPMVDGASDSGSSGTMRSGCGCHVGGSRPGRRAIVVLVVVAMVNAKRRRRTRGGSRRTSMAARSRAARSAGAGGG